MAQRTPMGPVYVNVPIETMLQPWNRPARLDKVPPATPPRAPVPDIERIAELLIGAKIPVITTEAAGRQPEAYAALRARRGAGDPGDRDPILDFLQLLQGPPAAPGPELHAVLRGRGRDPRGAQPRAVVPAGQPAAQRDYRGHRREPLSRA